MLDVIKTSISFTKNLFAVGAIKETEPETVDEICSKLDTTKKTTVIEFGMGYGNMTRKILNSISKDSLLYSFEINNEFCQYVKKNIKRAIFIALIGLLMSILTKSIFGSWFIVFGIFQFIAVSIILSIPIQLNYNHVFVIVLIFALLLLNCINFSKQNSINLQSIITGSLSPKYKFLDFFPLLPYFIFVVIGILIGNLNFNLKFNEKVKNNVVIKEIRGMGRWSIQLYFLHVLIIYGIMKIVIGKKNIKI